MAIAVVQRVGKGSVAASISIGSGDGWGTPTAGNLLVVSANSDALVTLSTSGFTAGPSIVDSNAAYAWYKFASGSESVITATPSTSDDIVLTACEYSGVAAFDASNSSTIAVQNGTTTTAASVTTTAAADLIIGFALLHSYTTTPTGQTWTNSFTNVLAADSGTTSGSGLRSCTFVAELLPAGAAGSYSTSASWTNAAGDRQHIIMAFTAAAGAPAVPPILVMAPRR